MCFATRPNCLYILHDATIVDKPYGHHVDSMGVLESRLILSIYGLYGNV